MRLSEHFTLEEMTFSQTAVRKGLVNQPNAGEVHNLERLAVNLMEPARALLGVPLRVSSGYRSPALNRAVGGATGSAHMDGRAVDFVPIGIPLIEAFDLIRKSTLPYDQVIQECGAWIHLACSRAGADPRRQALTATGGPGHWSYKEVME